MRKRILYSVAAILAGALAAKVLYPWYARERVAVPRHTPGGLGELAGWKGRDPNAAETFRFVVLGDRTGRTEAGAWANAVADVNRLRPDFVMTVGDFIDGFADDTDALRAEWEEFESVNAALDAPMFFCPGNHDVGTPKARGLYMSRHGVGRSGYYTVNYRQCRFIVIDTIALLDDTDDAQWKWLARELAPDGDVRHVFIFGHHPLFNFPEWERFREMLGGCPVTCFFGHDHALSYGLEDGVPCYVLGPTGAAGGGPQATGRFQSFLHVSVGSGKPTVAVIPLGEILPHDIVRRPALKAPTTAPTLTD